MTAAPRARSKYIDPSRVYRYVYIYQKYIKGTLGALVYRAHIRRDKIKHSSWHPTEREAALRIDTILIEHKLEPVNILKRKIDGNSNIYPRAGKPQT